MSFYYSDSQILLHVRTTWELKKKKKISEAKSHLIQIQSLSGSGSHALGLFKNPNVQSSCALLIIIIGGSWSQVSAASSFPTRGEQPPACINSYTFHSPCLQISSAWVCKMNSAASVVFFATWQFTPKTHHQPYPPAVGDTINAQLLPNLGGCLDLSISSLQSSPTEFLRQCLLAVSQGE